MSTYSTPTLLKETLNNGRKIPTIFYQMNPLRDPNKRINHYRNNFQDDTNIMNQTQSFFRKAKELEKSKKKKNKSKMINNKLYNSLYSKIFLRINYERPREIKNENGVIISRHFKTLDINSKEYPEDKIKTFYFINKMEEKKYIFNNNIINNNNFSGSNFFRTEIKVPTNKNIKNLNNDIETIKKYNSNSNSNSNINNNFFNKTGYSSKWPNKFLNIENYKTNSSLKKYSYNNKFKYEGIPPLLINKNKKSINKNKKLNNDIDKVKTKFKFRYEDEKSNHKNE